MKLMRSVLKWFSLILVITAFSCCKEDEDPQPENKPDLVLEFSHFFNGNDLEFEKIYLTPNQDSVSFARIVYLVSNVKLTNSVDGSEFNVEAGDFLVKPVQGQNTVELRISGNKYSLPTGTWDGIEFYIGLDSATNFAPESAPKLFTDEGMFWTWNTGYKFFVSEGKYFSSSLSFPFVGVTIHVGDMVNLVNLSYDLNPFGGINLKTNKTSRINFDVHIEELFDNPNPIDLSNSTYRQVTGGTTAEEYRQNYSNGFWELKSTVSP